MNAHQVITGALNKGENVFACGSVEGINFTVCAVGMDVVVLAADFERVQVIPGSAYGEQLIVSSVSACNDSGKIAATYGNVVSVLEPTHYLGEKTRHRLDYRWFETQRIDVGHRVRSILWSLEGLRLLISTGSHLFLYQHRALSVHNREHSPVTFSIEEKDKRNENDTTSSSAGIWNCVWSTQLSSPACFIRYSPDGIFFATSGQHDSFVRIWYQDMYESERTCEIMFNCIFLHHPVSVSGFEWRKTGRYMPRRCVQNVLITWCMDNTSRIWKETSNLDSLDLNGDVIEPSWLTVDSERRYNKKAQYSRVRNTRTRIIHRLKHLMSSREKKSIKDAPSQAIMGVPSTVSKSSSMNDVLSSQGIHLPTTLHFHLAATINADTDCLLVPLMGGDVVTRPFAVHWLNNKELVFSVGAEKLLAEALLTEKSQLSPLEVPAMNGEISITVPVCVNHTAPCDQVVDSSGTESPCTAPKERASVSNGSSTDAKDLLDTKLEVLLKNWVKTSDILFTVHPVDGSLLTWTVEWMDDTSRQPVVSFSSRFPGAFPLTDASSLNLSLNTFNPHDPIYVDILQRHASVDDREQQQQQQQQHVVPSLPAKWRRSRPNLLFLLTSHENGSLNLWHLSMDEHSNYATILNITHKSRMCGHRFQISQVIAHPVLPLLLTASQYSGNLTRTEDEKDDQCMMSELILWKVYPVGPLCKSGGVKELARMTSNSSKAFTCLAWIPAILPSSTLGSVCNSPSSCFVASDGACLRVYQAVVDARVLLAEIAQSGRKLRNVVGTRSESPASSEEERTMENLTTLPSLHETYEVVSTQSTARPGCVLQLGTISNANHNTEQLVLMHIFNERMMMSPSDEEENPTTIRRRSDSVVVDRSKSVTFSDRYFIVLVERLPQNGSRLLMWCLDMGCQAPFLVKSYEQRSSTDNREESNSFYRSASPMAPYASRLFIGSRKVYDQPLDLEDNVTVISAVPAAGHLPSSSLYPACRAPYVLLTACSDDTIRFWRCLRTSTNGRPSYSWQQWKMISDTIDSALEMDGSVYGVSAAHSGRFACACAPAGGVRPSSADHRIEIGVYECESSGGVEWFREDTLFIQHTTNNNRLPRLNDFGFHKYPMDDIHDPIHQHYRMSSILGHHDNRSSTLLSRIRSVPSMGTDMKRVVSDHSLRTSHISHRALNASVRIDWVSTEDGSHILTVGIGALVYMYAKVSQDIAQRNILLMKEPEMMKRAPLRKSSSLAGPDSSMPTKMVRWQCMRCLELSSADGLPPMPTALTWVRDGMLIVGMQSEMRVYNQWNLRSTISSSSSERERDGQHAKLTNMKRKPTGPSSLHPTSLAVTPSSSMLDTLAKRAKLDAASSTGGKNKALNDIMSRSRVGAREMGTDSSTQWGESVAAAVSDEGLFEAARLANPILPQYHPKQLIEMLNAGHTRRVKAVLLHVLRSLKQRNRSVTGALGRAASLRRMASIEGSSEMENNVNPVGDTRRLSFAEESGPDYDEVDGVPPLPLYALMAAETEGNRSLIDIARNKQTLTNGSIEPGKTYDSLFQTTSSGENGELEEMLAVDDDDDLDGQTRRSRHSSNSSDAVSMDNGIVPIAFTARNNRALTDLLTHTHLPGLSSVDQMHLLAVADTLSHFSSDVMDKLAQANAALQPTVPSVLNDATLGGYAVAGQGIDSVDECGLRYLMAMKQHEYLLLCLPLKQRHSLKTRGLAPSHVIWALHSETETELLNALSALHKNNPTWDDVKAMGMAWWLKNANTLKTVVEKLAKAAFQQKEDPLDAALFYLAMKKKNVLTILFKSVKDQKMTDFFQQDFSAERWRKAALKNAFVLMGKQRFQHAAAFFLLGGSLKDAIQTIVHRLGDLQLAMVLIRLHEVDPEKQAILLRDLLCREVLAMDPMELNNASIGGTMLSSPEDEAVSKTRTGIKSDPFERSMSFWLLREYSRAASTLLEEATQERLETTTQSSLSDIFNFYSFLRRHPLVVRQRLADAGVQMGSTEKFLAVARQLESRVTPGERRLYFRTAAAHLAGGCPILALDVLARLPKTLSMVVPGSNTLTSIVQVTTGEVEKAQKNDFDWSAPTEVKEEGLQLTWSDDDEDVEETKGTTPTLLNGVVNAGFEEQKETNSGVIDIISQHMKFVACLKILTEELSTLASGFEVDGGQLRFQLFKWLEREIEILKQLCDYQSTEDDLNSTDGEDEDGDDEADTPALHQALKADRQELVARMKATTRRRRWLTANQKLLRSFTTFCTLHSAQNYRLTSALMELLLLLLDVQQDIGPAARHLAAPLPDSQTFPLLTAAVSSGKMFLASPLVFIENQCGDLLESIAELTTPPVIEHHFSKVCKFTNLCEGLSSCVYQSLSDADSSTSTSHLGVLARRRKSTQMTGEDTIQVSTLPSRWPGVETLVALMVRDRDEEAPHLRQLLAECFTAVTMALTCYALAAYDARWLFRLAAHSVDGRQFAAVFGGGGELRLSATVPARPPRPPSARLPSPRPNENMGSASSSSPSLAMGSASSSSPSLAIDSSAIRAKFNAKIFGSPAPSPIIVRNQAQVSAIATQKIETTVLRWVSPSKSLLQLYSEKPSVRSREELGVDYDSDDAQSDDDQSEAEDEEEDTMCQAGQSRRQCEPGSFAWRLMRAAAVAQLEHRLRLFLTLAGFDCNAGGDLAIQCPRIDSMLNLLESWRGQLEEDLRQLPDGCPSNLLPNSNLDMTDSHLGPSLRKYRTLIEPGNTPFECDIQAAMPMRRLWAYLVRQEHLTHIFIRHIFTSRAQDEGIERTRTEQMADQSPDSLPDAYKIVQREHETIAAFAISQVRPGWLVVSTGRELQEMDVSGLLESDHPPVWMNNRTELDIALSELRRDPLKDNDDFQLLIEGVPKKAAAASSFMSPFIVDRSRKALLKLLKRQVTGIRRMDSHPSLPYYVSGSNDGSIRLWEWGVGQPLVTARPTGQYAKVTKVMFSPHGNKFAAVDGDGLLCLWQASHGLPVRKPFFNQKCHSKSAADVRFMGHTSTLLVTAGYGSGEQNLALWDTLLPSSKAMVHSWSCHPEGATCVLYMPQHQTVVSGGRHGELCLWDVRQRALRSTLKAFDGGSVVKCLSTDSPSQELIVAGSSDGDIKVWSGDAVNPEVLYVLSGEHVSRSGFSLRGVAGGVQGVQQLFLDSQTRLFSCGGDCSLKMRCLPSSSSSSSSHGI